MKNPEKLAASKKQPKYPIYEEGGRIVFIRPGMQRCQQQVLENPELPATNVVLLAKLNFSVQEW